MHEGVKTLVGLFLSLVGEVEVDHGRFELGMPEVALDETRVHARFEQMGGVGMSQGMDSDAHFGDTGALFGFTEGALDTAPTHGSSRGRALLVITPGGGKEPSLVMMGFPVGAQQCERLGGQGDVPIFGALAAVDMDLQALTIDVGDLEEEGFMEPEAQAIDRGAVDLVVERGGGRQESPHFLHTEDSGEVVGGLRAQERQRGPVACEDVVIEEANTTVADAHGGWGEAVDVFAVQEVVLQLLFRDAVG